MLFEDYHLFMFEIGERRYGYPDPEWGDEIATPATFGSVPSSPAARPASPTPMTLATTGDTPS